MGPPIHLGGADKIVALCQGYYKAETELWQPDISLADYLASNTLTAPRGHPSSPQT
jgi:hypothetical protein